MTLAGIDFRGKAEALRVAGVLAVETLAAAIGFVTVIYGPLWPIGRLSLLNTDDGSLAAEGIYNPNAQRTFSWVALCCLLTLLAYVVLGQGDPRWNIAAAMAGGLYLWITYVMFEWSIFAAMKRVGMWLKEAGYMVAICVLGIAAYVFVLAVTTDKNSKVEPTSHEDDKAKTFAGLTIATIVIFAGTGIYIALEKTWCTLLVCQ